MKWMVVFQIMFALSFERLVFAQTSLGTLKIKAGVIFKSGDVRPVARTDFYLIPSSLTSITAESAERAGLQPQSLEEFIVDQTIVSSEFRKWARTNAVKIDDELAFAINKVKLDDLINVPEFLDWLKEPTVAKVPRYPKLNQNAQKQAEQIQKYRTALQKNMKEGGGFWVQTMLQAIRDYLKARYASRGHDREDRLAVIAESAARRMAIAQTKTSLEGTAEFQNVPVGTYWISNITSTVVGNSTILWDLKVQIEDGKTISLELSNDNASRIQSVP